MRTHIPIRVGSVLAIALGCRVDAEVGTGGLGSGDGDETAGAADSPATEGVDDGPTGASIDGTAASADTGSLKLDVGADTDTIGPGDACKVTDDMNAVGDCEVSAPPDSFTPDIQWTFGEGIRSLVLPLVANMTDDNGDGEIDLCDTPDVVLVAGGGNVLCDLYVLDGATGEVHFTLALADYDISCQTSPALGDIDGDGIVEIVAGWLDGDDFGSTVPRLRAFEHDGTEKWTNTDGGSWLPQDEWWMRAADSIALHDLDADGDVEIIFDHEVYDHEGNVLWYQIVPEPWERSGSVGADLDGDGQMEVLVGHAAYHHDGTVAWDLYPTISRRSIPQVANLDDDPEPEVFVTSDQGIFMVEHDGTLAYGPVIPTGVPAAATLVWQRPGTIHDFDGDQVSEWASSSREYYAVYRGPDAADMLWSVVISDQSGAAAGTAFDFLGDGIAEAMYADEGKLRVYDGSNGAVLLEANRTSLTYFEYPTVADVDNDGSAEILVVSDPPQPALQVLRDAEDRWIQARRIWNQHAYYVTNVREDGTIPQQPVDPWKSLNTYRTQAQIEGGALCKPEPEG